MRRIAEFTFVQLQSVQNYSLSKEKIHKERKFPLLHRKKEMKMKWGREALEC